MRGFKAQHIALSVVIFLSLLLVTNDVNAQIAGRIAGRVTDAGTNDYLPGAEVVVQGTNLGSTTDREGSFRISNVPPGSYTISVSYIGYKEYSMQVTVDAGKTVNLDIPLTVSYVSMEEVVVTGLREGQVKALSQQRTASNIVNVVSQEQMERFPDVNVAEVMQRVPGVSIDRSQGDGRYVFIRGTAPGLNYVTVNGQKLATNRVEERYAQLDIIAASQLATIEVSKALTPDMDGDAIGGAINLVTRSAFDYPGSRFSLTLAPGYAKIDNKLIGLAKLNYSTLLGANKNFGLTVTGNWDEKQRGTDGMEFDFDDTEDINNNPIPFALDQFDLRDYRRTRTRTGFGSDLEYRPNNQHRWIVRGMYSKLKDDQWRGRWRIRAAGDFLNPEGTLTEDSRIIMVHTQRVENLTQTSFSGGGVHTFGNMDLDYTIAHSYANEEHPEQLESEWQLDTRVNLSLDLSEPKFPKWELAGLDNSYQYDASKYEFDGMDFRSTYANNWQTVGGLNLKMPFSLGSLPSEFKLGGKYRRDKKDRDEDRWRIRWRGDQDLFLNQFQADFQDDDFMNGNYVYGPAPDGDRLQDFFNENVDQEGGLEREIRWFDSEAQHYVSRENIYAYYAMATVNVGKLRLLGGFRHEITDADYNGNIVELDDQGENTRLEPVTVARDYSNFLPMVHLRYSLTPRTNIRAAYTQTLSRPNYWNVTPYYFLDIDGEEIEQGNPNLKPMTSKNLDLMIEHYMQGIGIASGGLFFKSLKDIIFERESKIVGGTFDDFDFTEPVNGESAKLYGIELAWNQELSFLPGFLNGFGIYANYTHTWTSDVNLFDETDPAFGRKGFVPGQSGDIANVSLSYEKSGFSARLSGAYQDESLETVGRNQDYDEWKGSHFQLDFSAVYDIRSWLQVFADVVNLTNEPSLEFYGIEDRPKLQEFYSWWAQVGIKIRR